MAFNKLAFIYLYFYDWWQMKYIHTHIYIMKEQSLISLFLVTWLNSSNISCLLHKIFCWLDPIIIWFEKFDDVEHLQSFEKFRFVYIKVVIYGRFLSYRNPNTPLRCSCLGICTFVLDILKTKCNLSIFGAMFDIFTVTSTSQYSLMFWSALGDSYQQMKRNPGNVSIE